MSIPSDAKVLVLGVGGRILGGNAFTGAGSSVTFNSSAMTIGFDADNNDNIGGALWYISIPEAWRGTSKSFAWDWTGSGSASEGVRFLYAFYSGADEASPVRDSKGEQTGTSYDATNLAAQSGDLAVCHATVYSPGSETLSWANATAVVGSEGDFGDVDTEMG